MTQPTKRVRKAICYILLLLLAAELVQCSPPPPAPSRRGQRWGVAATHNNVMLLSAIGGSSEYPAWSPDGTQIAFQHTEYRFGSVDIAAPRDIYIMDADGTNERRLTQGAEMGISCKYPSWHPDSQRLVISCSRYRKRDYDLYILDAKTGTRTLLTHYDGDEFSPTWSPDGTRIAFASKMGTDEGYDIYIIDSDGTNLVRFTQNDNTWNFDATWSPNGQRIAFSSGESYASAKVCLTNTSGSTLTCFANAKCNDSAWSPEGTWIACVDNSKIIRVTPKSQMSSTLLDAGLFVHGVSWSPDGTQLVFAAGAEVFAAQDLYMLTVEP